MANPDRLTFREADEADKPLATYIFSADTAKDGGRVDVMVGN